MAQGAAEPPPGPFPLPVRGAAGGAGGSGRGGPGATATCSTSTRSSPAASTCGCGWWRGRWRRRGSQRDLPRRVRPGPPAGAAARRARAAADRRRGRARRAGRRPHGQRAGRRRATCSRRGPATTTSCCSPPRPSRAPWCARGSRSSTRPSRERIRPWPQIVHALLRRAVRRTMELNVHRAATCHPRADARIALLLWHLAERWGIVEPDGILVPLPLTHRLIGQLVGAERPSVSHALARLSSAGPGHPPAQRPDPARDGGAPHGLPRRSAPTRTSASP